MMVMIQDEESVFDEQIRQWVGDYKRLFESSENDVSLSEDEQVPAEEMRRYIENYKKWFCAEVTIEEQRRNLAKLKKVHEGWKLNLGITDKFSKFVEKRLLEA